jgi:hypothetical protein
MYDLDLSSLISKAIQSIKKLTPELVTNELYNFSPSIGSL